MLSQGLLERDPDKEEHEQSARGRVQLAHQPILPSDLVLVNVDLGITALTLGGLRSSQS